MSKMVHTPQPHVPMCEVRQRLREQARRAQAPVEGGVAAETAPTVSTGGPGGSTPAREVPQSRGRRATEEAKTEGKGRNPRAQKKCEIALPTPRGSVGLGGGEGGCTAVANDVAVMWRTRSRASSIPWSGEADEYEGSSLKIEHELICLTVSKEESGASQQTAEAFRQSFRDNCWYLEESLLPGLSKERGKQLQKVHRILRAAHGAVDTWNQADGLEGI
ncbi:hypothetical protein BSKO_02827 [Bryopsis sp. KO-2023]|nr:hypothetical protein BSKO_02827 [Bryopsis sp. KO-2023]